MKGTGNMPVYEQSSLVSSTETSEYPMQMLLDSDRVYTDITTISIIN